MNYSSIFNKEIFENVIRELNGECRISRGYTSQIAGSTAFSATTTSIITYVLSKLDSLSNEEKRKLGLMYGLGKSCVILKKKNAKQPSDVQGIEYIQYENTDELNNQLKDWLKENIK